MRFPYKQQRQAHYIVESIKHFYVRGLHNTKLKETPYSGEEYRFREIFPL